MKVKNDHQLGISRASAANALDIKVNTRRNIPFLQAAMCYLVCYINSDLSDYFPKILPKFYEGHTNVSEHFPKISEVV